MPDADNQLFYAIHTPDRYIYVVRDLQVAEQFVPTDDPKPRTTPLFDDATNRLYLVREHHEIYEVEDGKLLQTDEHSLGLLTNAMIHPDTKEIWMMRLTENYSMTVEIWNPDTNTTVQINRIVPQQGVVASVTPQGR